MEVTRVSKEHPWGHIWIHSIKDNKIMWTQSGRYICAEAKAFAEKLLKLQAFL
jgi:hypothetical protein